MKRLPFEIQDNRKLRVIIDTDAGCEADDQYAIAHALLSGKIDVVGILAEHFGHIQGSMRQSFEEIHRVCELMGMVQVPVYEGAQGAIADPANRASGSDKMQARGLSCSPAGRFLIEEALREDSRPLFVLCQGALTNVAEAIKAAPEIQDRIQIVMVGGTKYPVGGFEFNTMNDPAAFNIIMNSSAAVWVLPEEVYATMQAGMMELYTRVSKCGKIGAYLYKKTAETALRMAKMVPVDPAATPFETVISFPNGESWSLGDSAAVGLLLMHHAGDYKEVAAPNVLADGTYIIPDRNRKIRWYTSINQRFILEDFYTKLAYFFGEG